MTISTKDYDAFVDFEKDAWVRLSEHYDTWAGQMTRQATGTLLDRANLRQAPAFWTLQPAPAMSLRRPSDEGPIPSASTSRRT